MGRENTASHSRLDGGQRRGRVARLASVAFFVFGLAAGPGTAQTLGTPLPLDSTWLGPGSGLRMHTLLEKTIFKVDVLTVEVWLGEEDSRRIEEIVAAGRYTSEVADGVAEVAIHSEDAVVRLEFVRDVSLEQFLGGIDENLRLVPGAGIIPEADFKEISENLPRWFAFLAERGIHKGDAITYLIRGDTLRTRYLAPGGQLLLDQTDVGASARLSVLGSYFVRESEFRKGLVSSLFGDR